MNRRSFIRNSFGLLVAAPMVVRADSLMKLAMPKSITYYIPHDAIVGSWGYINACESLMDELLIPLAREVGLKANELDQEFLYSVVGDSILERK